MSDIIHVVIIGAGPYRLSLAAHLRTAGVSNCHFDIRCGFGVRVRSNMSLVGPRRERLYFTERASGRFPFRWPEPDAGADDRAGSGRRAQRAIRRLSNDCFGGHYMEYRSILQDLVLLERAVGAIISSTRPVMS